MSVLERTQFIPRPRAEVFAFFEDARNLEAITPPFLKFKVTTPGAIEMKPGTLIDYRLRIFGVPFGWRTEIAEYEPNERFVDQQLKGPYKRWHHTHTFEDVTGGTRMKDRVEYEVPLGPLGSIAHVVFVKRMVNAIFDYRAKEIARRFDSP